MVSYVDTTVTLNAITTPPNAYQHLQPHGRKVWVAISNGPQGPLTLSAFSEKGAGEPAVIIDAGQPFMGQIDYYILTVSGVAGQVFNVKIQDEPFQPGKKQHVSASGATAQQFSSSLGTASNATVYTCPVGYRARILRIFVFGVAGQTVTVYIGNAAFPPNAGIGWGGAIIQYIANALAIPAGGVIQYAPSGNSTVVEYANTWLLAGDYVYMGNLSVADAIAYWVEILQEPL